MRGITLVYLSLCATLLLQAEPSVYGFSRSSTSSGSSSYESAESKNRKEILRLKRELAKQNEKIAGLTSIVEGLSDTVAKLQQGSHTQGGDNSQLLHALGDKIDTISATYVRKDELSGLIGKSLPEKSVQTKPKKKEKVSPKTQPLEKKSLATLYKEGARCFVKKEYDEAFKRFTITDEKGYKPAASNYYLGEISYYTKKYQDAIFYFKKSAGLYDKASYIDVLLLHTAISLEKTGEKSQAKVFYNNIIANYEGRKSAAIAKQRVKRL